jgi:hypothetical protein
MKLSEKIQEALRQQQEINLSDPVVQKRLAAQWGYVPADAQPAPSFADAYQGAMEEVAIWKRRALEAEDLNRKFIAEINGPTHMGEPAQPAPSVFMSMLRPTRPLMGAGSSFRGRRRRQWSKQGLNPVTCSTCIEYWRATTQ